MRGFAWSLAVVVLVIFGVAGASELDSEATIPSIEHIVLRFDEMCPLRFCEGDDDAQTAIFEASELFPYDARVEYIDYKPIGIELYQGGVLSSVHQLRNGAWSSRMIDRGGGAISDSALARPLEFSCAPNS